MNCPTFVDGYTAYGRTITVDMHRGVFPTEGSMSNRQNKRQDRIRRSLRKRGLCKTAAKYGKEAVKETLRANMQEGRKP